MNTHYFIGIKVPKPISREIIDARGKTNLHQTHKTLPVVDDLHITLVLFRACGEKYNRPNVPII